MSVATTKTLVFRGKIYWAKVLGDPVLDYDKTAKEWTFDFVPNDVKEAAAELKALGVGDRLRSKEGHLDGQKYMTLKQKELKADGSPNKPIEVVDIAQQPWDADTKIGNESIVDVKFAVVDNGPKRYKGVYPRSVRILELVPYAPQAFNELDENDEYYEAAKAAEAEAAAAAQRDKDIALLGGNKVKDDDDVDPEPDVEVEDDPLDDEIPID